MAGHSVTVNVWALAPYPQSVRRSLWQFDGSHSAHLLISPQFHFGSYSNNSIHLHKAESGQNQRCEYTLLGDFPRCRLSETFRDVVLGLRLSVNKQ